MKKKEIVAIDANEQDKMQNEKQEEGKQEELQLDEPTKGKSSKKKEKNENGASFPVVGVGASAGGLEALQEFFDNMPKEPGAAFVVVQHLSPDYKSFMSELLSRHTSSL